jgi:hypothetical protein
MGNVCRSMDFIAPTFQDLCITCPSRGMFFSAKSDLEAIDRRFLILRSFAFKTRLKFFNEILRFITEKHSPFKTGSKLVK